ncbi:MAG TPA: LapA family protein [Solirubrobacterales bacterium]|nr:LapA family protein [Solirubrobacterales bacterium]
MEGASRSEGRGARFWLTIVLLAIGFIFIAVNFQKVTIDFVVGEAKAPLVVALLISGVIGFLIGLVLPRFRRHEKD